MRSLEVRKRRGLVLLEVIVALTIFSVAGVSVVTLAAGALSAMARAHQADVASQKANHFFDAVSLWPRADLDRHLGDRSEGPWRLRVERPMPTLYVVSLRDSATDRILFATSLYRPEPLHAMP